MSSRPKTAFARRAEFYDQIISDSGLSLAATRVAWRLVNHINDDTGECFPSVERLAAGLDINERTVRRGVDQLVDAGWFTKKRRGRGGTQYYANYENRTGMSGITNAEKRTGMSGKDGENRTGMSAITNAEKRTGLSAINGERKRTDLSIKPDKPVQRNRTDLSGLLREPKGEPLQEPHPPPRVPPLPHDEPAEAVRLWNELAGRIGHPKVQVVSPARRRSVARRLAECGGLDGWRVALSKVGASAFLTGANDRGWRADFDFMVQQKSFTRLMEGCYDDQSDSGGKDGGDGSGGGRRSAHAALYAAGAAVGAATAGRPDHRMPGPAAVDAEGTGPDVE